MADSTPAGLSLASEVAAFIRARRSLFWIQSKEEQRVERSLVEAVAASGYRAIFWDCVRGAVDVMGAPVSILRAAKDGNGVAPTPLVPAETRGPSQIIGVVETERKRAMEAAAAYAAAPTGEAIVGLERIVWVLRDFEPYLKAEAGARRALRNLAASLPDSPREGAHAVILLSTSGDVPPDLADAIVKIEWTLPDRAELDRILTVAIDGLPEKMRATAAPNGIREAAVEAAVGLTANGALTIYRKSLIQRGGKIDPVLVSAEKKRVVNATAGVEYIDPDPRGLAAVGGLDNLKAWLLSRQNAFGEAARKFGLKPPKGIIFVGVPGCGKSLTAKAVASAWGVPLLRLDLGAVKGGIVGQSERQMREALSLAETIGRCVLWIDEIEKAFAGASGGANDGGVSASIFGTFLSWMQDRKSPVFVMATANRVDQLPPELLRKGRFDVIWSVDLPTVGECAEILRVGLKSVNRSLSDADLSTVARECRKREFVGAEVASLVDDALAAAFADGMRDLTVADLLEAARAIVPLAKSAAESIKALRAWSQANARPASRPEAPEAPSVAHGLQPSAAGTLDFDPLP